MIWLPPERKISVPKSRQRGMMYINPYAVAAASNPNAVNLYNNMLSYWNFNENDGGSTFADSLGNHPLTVRETGGTTTTALTTNTTSIESRAFNAANTAGRTAYIPVSDGYKLPNADWTFGGWFQADFESSGSAAFMMGNFGNGTYQALMFMDGTTTHLHMNLTSNGTTPTTLDTGATLSNTVYTLITCTLDRANNQMIVRKQQSGGSRENDSAAFASALYTGSPGNFNINDGVTGDSTYASGARAGVKQADLCFICLRAITDAEFDYLYNGAAGKTWAQISADAGH